MYDSGQFVSLSNGLRSALNIALGISPTDMQYIDANFIASQLSKQDSSNSDVSSDLYILTHLWSLEFTTKFSASPKWGVVPAYDLVDLKAYRHIVHVEHKAADKQQAVNDLLGIFKRVKTYDDGYGTVLNIIKNAMVYGLLKSYLPITAAGAFILEATLAVEEVR